MPLHLAYTYLLVSRLFNNGHCLGRGHVAFRGGE